MDSTHSTNFRHDEESRSARNKDGHLISRLRTEEEKFRRRQEWQRQQERERQHEKLKQQKILEYEKKRAQALKLSEQKASHHSRSRSDSKSPPPRHYRGRSTSNASKSGTLYEKLDGPTSGAVPLFKGIKIPQSMPISTTELRRIKVDIRRNIPAKGTVSELQRDIVNPEEVVLQRREGEGCKPIFDREEIKTAIGKNNAVEEQRTVVAVDREQSVSTSKIRTSRKRSSSLSPTRNRSYSPGYVSSYQPRYRTDSKRHDSKTDYHEHRKNYGRSSVERRREHKDRYTDRDANRHVIHRSRSRERHPSTSNSRSFMEDRSHRDRLRHERSSESRSREKRDRDRDRSREPRDVTPHYIEPVHVPIYYGSFPPRPIVVSPMVPFRGQVPPMGRGRHPGLMAPVRPFPPRFIPPDMYRLGPPPNPRYGPY